MRGLRPVNMTGGGRKIARTLKRAMQAVEPLARKVIDPPLRGLTTKRAKPAAFVLAVKRMPGPRAVTRTPAIAAPCVSRTVARATVRTPTRAERRSIRSDSHTDGGSSGATAVKHSPALQSDEPL